MGTLSKTQRPIYKVIPVDLSKPVEIEKISDIKSWSADLGSIKLIDRRFSQQENRETRESVLGHPDKEQRKLHWSEFGIKITNLMEKIRLIVRDECPDDEPDLTNNLPDWLDYNKIYTTEERQAIDQAKRQRVFKEMIMLELEEIMALNVALNNGVFERNQEARRRNLWLIHFINEMVPDLENVSTSDEPPYLTLVEIAATLPTRRKKKAE